MRIHLSAAHMARIEELRAASERVFIHLDIFGRVIRIDRYHPGSWIAPSYELYSDGSMRRC